MAFGYGRGLGVRYTPGGAAPHPPGTFNFEAYVISFTPIFLVNDYQHCWECTFDGFVSLPSYRYVHCGNGSAAISINSIVYFARYDYFYHGFFSCEVRTTFTDFKQ